MAALGAQQQAFVAAAKATVELRRGIGVSLQALQYIEAAVARTPASQMHTLIHDCFSMLKGRGVNVPERVETAAEAGQLLSTYLRQTENAMSRSSSLTTGDPAEVTPTLRPAQPTPAALTPDEVEQAVLNGMLATPEREYHVIARIDSTPDGPLLIDPPSALVGGVMRPFFAHEVTDRREGETTRLYICRWMNCRMYHDAPANNRATVNAHIRRVHTKQLLICPAGSQCKKFKACGQIFSTHNEQSLRNHWKECRPQIE